MPFQAAVLKVWLIPGYIVTVVEIRKACGVIWANVDRAPQIEANQILDSQHTPRTSRNNQISVVSQLHKSNRLFRDQ